MASAGAQVSTNLTFGDCRRRGGPAAGTGVAGGKPPDQPPPPFGRPIIRSCQRGALAALGTCADREARRRTLWRSGEAAPRADRRCRRETADRTLQGARALHRAAQLTATPRSPDAARSAAVEPPSTPARGAQRIGAIKRGPPPAQVGQARSATARPANPSRPAASQGPELG